VRHQFSSRDCPLGDISLQARCLTERYRSYPRRALLSLNAEWRSRSGPDEIGNQERSSQKSAPSGPQGLGCQLLTSRTCNCPIPSSPTDETYSRVQNNRSPSMRCCASQHQQQLCTSAGGFPIFPRTECFLRHQASLPAGRLQRPFGCRRHFRSEYLLEPIPLALCCRGDPKSKSGQMYPQATGAFP
jgi:hypothetical protein